MDKSTEMRKLRRNSGCVTSGFTGRLGAPLGETAAPWPFPSGYGDVPPFSARPPPRRRPGKAQTRSPLSANPQLGSCCPSSLRCTPRSTRVNSEDWNGRLLVPQSLLLFFSCMCGVPADISPREGTPVPDSLGGDGDHDGRDRAVGRGATLAASYSVATACAGPVQLHSSCPLDSVCGERGVREVCVCVRVPESRPSITNYVAARLAAVPHHTARRRLDRRCSGSAGGCLTPLSELNLGWMSGGGWGWGI